MQQPNTLYMTTAPIAWAVVIHHKLGGPGKLISECPQPSANGKGWLLPSASDGATRAIVGQLGGLLTQMQILAAHRR